MKKYTLAIVFMCSLVQVFGQAQELNTLTSKLQENIVTVQTASKNYEGKLNPLQPGVLQYTYDEIDQKGNRVNYVYEFNLSDIDPYAVREQTQKDLITVVLAVRNKQKLVKVYKNNEVQSYDNQVAIVAKDIENARTISDIVKKAIPHAEKVMASRLKLSGFDAMVTWLCANVKDVELGTKSYKQTLTKGDRPGVLTLKQIESDGKSAVEEILTFNMADINVNSITFKISGNKFAINFEALQKSKYVSVRKNGEAKPFVNDVTINTNNVDEARDLKDVFTLAIPLAQEKVKADIPAVASENDGLQRIKTLATEVNAGNKQISQEIEPKCLATFKQVEKDAKSTQSGVYKFNWMDINPNTSNITVTGDKMFIKLTTNDNKKLVMNTVNDKFGGYENDIKLFMPDIESARRAKFAIDKVTEFCKTSYKEPFANNASAAASWILSNVKDTGLDEVTLKQTLEQVESGNNNKLKFTLKELNAKGTGAEEIYEFNMSDINPLSVEVVTKGKWLYVSVETEFKSKIIKYYKDGKIQPYANKIEFAVNDVETARNLVSALKKSVKGLKS